MEHKDNDIIDFNTYCDLLKYVSKHDIIEIYKEFEIETMYFLNKLKSLTLKNDSAEILSILHNIKGNASSLGLFAIAKYSEQTENEINEIPMSAKNDIYEKLLELYSKFTDNYERLLKIW
ncbi:MAG: HPt (histidine-containing phosphotransfer) domain-containing protein [Roseivirga sp.]